MAQSKGQLVRYQQGKQKFEVLTKPGSVLKFRAGKLGWDKVLMADAIFSNLSRGDTASGKDLEDVFGTTDIDACCKLIVEKGEVQLSAQERKEELDAKKNEVIQFIFKNFMDPKTKLPHPPDRIENCMKECHIKIDPKREAKKQAEDAVKSMAGKLTFTKQVSLIAHLFIKHSYLGQCNNVIHSSGHVMDQDWKSRPDGCVFVLELSKADLDRLTDALRKPTNGGDYEMKIEAESKTMSNTDASQEAPKKSSKSQTQSQSQSQAQSQSKGGKNKNKAKSDNTAQQEVEAKDESKVDNTEQTETTQTTQSNQKKSKKNKKGKD